MEIPINTISNNPVAPAVPKDQPVQGAEVAVDKDTTADEPKVEAKKDLNIQFFRKVKNMEKAFFSSQMATMIEAGLHVTQILDLLAGQSKNKYFKEILVDLSRLVAEGKPLSKGLEKYPDVFDGIYINMVKSGEASGRMSEVMAELGQQLERSTTFSSKIKGALAYPAFVMVVMAGVAVMTSVKIIPALKPIFTEAKVELPAATKMILALSDIMINQWWILVVIILGLYFGVKFGLKTPGGKILLDRLILKEPSGLAQRVYIARFTRTFGSLIKTGIPIVKALKLTAMVIGNSVYEQKLNDFASQIERGIPLSMPMRKDNFFPPFLSQMVAVGEQTGKLDQVMLDMAKYFERESDDKIKGLTTMFEPIVIVLIAIGVAFLVFAIIMPIYSISQNI